MSATSISRNGYLPSFSHSWCLRSHAHFRAEHSPRIPCPLMMFPATRTETFGEDPRRRRHIWPEVVNLTIAVKALKILKIFLPFSMSFKIMSDSSRCWIKTCSYSWSTSFRSAETPSLCTLAWLLVHPKGKLNFIFIIKLNKHNMVGIG